MNAEYYDLEKYLQAPHLNKEYPNFYFLIKICDTVNNNLNISFYQ